MHSVLQNISCGQTSSVSNPKKEKNINIQQCALPTTTTTKTTTTTTKQQQTNKQVNNNSNNKINLWHTVSLLTFPVGMLPGQPTPQVVVETVFQGKRRSPVVVRQMQFFCTPRDRRPLTRGLDQLEHLSPKEKMKNEMWNHIISITQTTHARKNGHT